MELLNKITTKFGNMPVPAKASISFVICNIIQKSMYFIMIPIFTRIMSTEQYGLYSVFSSYVTFIAAFAGLNLAGNSYNVGMIKYSDKQDYYTSVIQGLWHANTTLWFIIFLLFSKTWTRLSGLSIGVLTAIFIDIYATGCFDLWTAKQKFDFKYKEPLFFTFLLSALTVIISLVAVPIAAEKGYIAIWCKVLVLVFIGIITGLINVKKGKSLYNKSIWLSALKFNIPLIAYYLSLSVLSQSDRIMISSMKGNAQAGIYSVAYSLAMILTMINNAINSAFTPWEFKKISANEKKNIYYYVNLIVFGVGMLNLMLIAVSPEIIYILTAKEYHVAVWVIPPVAFSAYLMFVYQLFVNIEFYDRKNIFVMVASIGVAVLNIVLNYIFIKIYGYIAAAYTTLFSYLCFTLIHYVFMKLACKNGDVYKVMYIFLISLIVAVGSVVFTLLYNNLILRYILLFTVVSLGGSVLLKYKNKFNF